MQSSRTRGIAAALLAAVTFGLTVPVAKAWFGGINPWLLAGLLYLGSGWVWPPGRPRNAGRGRCRATSCRGWLGRCWLRAHNPGATRSEAHWAQPCARLAAFTGFDAQGKDLDDYLPKCFIFLNGKLSRMSEIQPWVKEARYTPGQVWCPEDVPRTDVNPRPLSPLVPSLGLIGAFSADEKVIFATAWDSYQELFQGVARCLHSDFRLGGLQPGETKLIRGRIYVVRNDVPALLARYEKDFPR